MSSSKKITYTSEFKLKVLDYYFKHGGDDIFGLKTKTAVHFNVDKKTVNRMLNNAEMVKRARRLLAKRHSSSTKTSTPSSSKPPSTSSTSSSAFKSSKSGKSLRKVVSGGGRVTGGSGKAASSSASSMSAASGVSGGSVTAGLSGGGPAAATTAGSTASSSRVRCVGGASAEGVKVLELPEDPDYSLLKRSINASANGVANMAKLLVTGTEEVRKLMLNECDVILECKVCQNLFRSIVNFLAHKRIYCQESFADVRTLFHRDNTQGVTSQSGTVVVEPEEPPASPTPTQDIDTRSFIPPPHTSARQGGRTRRRIDSIADRLAGRQGRGTGGQSSPAEFATSHPTHTGSAKYYERLQLVNSARDKLSQDCSVVLEDIRGVPNARLQTFQPYSSFLASSSTSSPLPPMSQQLQEVSQRTSGVSVALGERGEIVRTARGDVDAMDVDKPATSKQSSGQGHDLLCRLCNTRFATSKTLSVHQRSFHGLERRVYSCPICKTSFITMRGVVKHLEKVHKKSKHQTDRLKRVIRKNMTKKLFFPTSDLGLEGEEGQAEAVGEGGGRSSLRREKLHTGETERRIAEGGESAIVESTNRTAPSGSSAVSRTSRRSVSPASTTSRKSASSRSSQKAWHRGEGVRCKGVSWMCNVCHKTFISRPASLAHVATHIVCSFEPCAVPVHTKDVKSQRLHRGSAKLRLALRPDMALPKKESASASRSKGEGSGQCHGASGHCATPDEEDAESDSSPGSDEEDSGQCQSAEGHNFIPAEEENLNEEDLNQCHSAEQCLNLTDEDSDECHSAEQDHLAPSKEAESITLVDINDGSASQCRSPSSSMSLDVEYLTLEPSLALLEEDVKPDKISNPCEVGTAPGTPTSPALPEEDVKPDLSDDKREEKQSACKLCTPTDLAHCEDLKSVSAVKEEENLNTIECDTRPDSPTSKALIAEDMKLDTFDMVKEECNMENDTVPETPSLALDVPDTPSLVLEEVKPDISKEAELDADVDNQSGPPTSLAPMGDSATYTTLPESKEDSGTSPPGTQSGTSTGMAPLQDETYANLPESEDCSNTWPHGTRPGTRPGTPSSFPGVSARSDPGTASGTPSSPSDVSLKVDIVSDSEASDDPEDDSDASARSLSAIGVQEGEDGTTPRADSPPGGTEHNPSASPASETSVNDCGGTALQREASEHILPESWVPELVPGEGSAVEGTANIHLSSPDVVPQESEGEEVNEFRENSAPECSKEVCDKEGHQSSAGQCNSSVELSAELEGATGECHTPNSPVESAKSRHITAEEEVVSAKLEEGCRSTSTAGTMFQGAKRKYGTADDNLGSPSSAKRLAVTPSTSWSVSEAFGVPDINTITAHSSYVRVTLPVPLTHQHSQDQGTYSPSLKTLKEQLVAPVSPESAMLHNAVSEDLTRDRVPPIDVGTVSPESLLTDRREALEEINMDDAASTQDSDKNGTVPEPPTGTQGHSDPLDLMMPRCPGEARETKVSLSPEVDEMWPPSLALSTEETEPSAEECHLFDMDWSDPFGTGTCFNTNDTTTPVPSCFDSNHLSPNCGTPKMAITPHPSHSECGGTNRVALMPNRTYSNYNRTPNCGTNQLALTSDSRHSSMTNLMMASGTPSSSDEFYCTTEATDSAEGDGKDREDSASMEDEEKKKKFRTVLGDSAIFDADLRHIVTLLLALKSAGKGATLARSHVPRRILTRSASRRNGRPDLKVDVAFGETTDCPRVSDSALERTYSLTGNSADLEADLALTQPVYIAGEHARCSMESATLHENPVPLKNTKLTVGVSKASATTRESASNDSDTTRESAKLEQGMAVREVLESVRSVIAVNGALQGTMKVSRKTVEDKARLEEVAIKMSGFGNDVRRVEEKEEWRIEEKGKRKEEGENEEEWNIEEEKENGKRIEEEENDDEEEEENEAEEEWRIEEEGEGKRKEEDKENKEAGKQTEDEDDLPDLNDPNFYLKTCSDPTKMTSDHPCQSTGEQRTETLVLRGKENKMRRNLLEPVIIKPGTRPLRLLMLKDPTGAIQQCMGVVGGPAMGLDVRASGIRRKVKVPAQYKWRNARTVPQREKVI